MEGLFTDLRPFIVAALSTVLAIIASGHVVLTKRDVRAAVGWVGLIWLVPVIGSLLYVTFGINRIRRRGRALRQLGRTVPPLPQDSRTDWRVVTEQLAQPDGHLALLARLVNRVSKRPLIGGNRVAPLLNGDEAYPAMLEAIDRAEQTVALSTYIFDHDDAGRAFADALHRAIGRGVEVRVLIDAFGARYSWPSMVGQLRKRGIRVAKFMHAVAPWRIPFLNLRTHRKILVADGRVGFTGGLNIRARHILQDSPKHPVRDLHFRFDGPVVQHLMLAFAEDWAFSANELLTGDTWFPHLDDVAAVLARGISDGPGDDFDKLRLALLGAVASAQRRITVVTPYFLPDRDLISALIIAAMRDVKVTVLVPAKNNLPLVQWASTALLWQLLERGCRFFLTPPPFDHTKLMLVDEAWVMVGSANWDPRSFRLNFEFNVECYDAQFASDMTEFVGEKLAQSRELTLGEVDGRSLPVKLRDGVARLLSPYL